MQFRIILCVVFFVGFFPLVASAQLYAAQAGTKIAKGNLSGIGLQPLLEGNDPAISPDGKEIAYTVNTKSGGRTIGVVDTKTGKSRIVEGIEGDNNYGPQWSPDGKHLYFNHFKGNDWVIARVNASGGEFKEIYAGSAAFAVLPNNTGLLCNDMSKFFLVSIKDGAGTVTKTLPVDPNFAGTSIPSRIDVSPAGDVALFEMIVENDPVLTPEDGMPHSSIWQVNLDNGSLTRMTPKGTDASFPSWLPDGGGFVFTSLGPKMERKILVKSIFDDAEPKPIAENASSATIAHNSAP